jgi:probable phosphoglycerate mutase
MTGAEKTTHFGLVRHAETVWNRQKRIQGHSDSPLSPFGEKQADKWGRRLKSFAWDRILSSDIGRALETARRINRYLQVPLDSDARLREQDWGQWTGKTVTRIEKEAFEMLSEQKTAGWNFRPPGGEDRLTVWKRSRQVLVEAAQRRPGETTMIVTHEGVIKSLIYRLSDRRFLPDEPELIRSYHLHWLIYTRNGLRLENINAVILDRH